MSHGPALRLIQGQPQPRQFLTQDDRLIRELDDLFVVAKPRQRKAVPVLIGGETGTGKTLLARDIHELSRPGYEFKIVDGPSLEPGLVNSELFGHMRGAFTGAVQAHEGLVSAADGGTLFLDEIALLPPELQAKLLRALQEGLCRKVGGTEDYKVDVRWIFATNADLAQLVAEEKFREDLYYRLCVAKIDIPPLRERPGDIGLIARAFLQKLELPESLLSRDALTLLESHPWYGNVRELLAVLETAVRRAEDKEILPHHIRFIPIPPKRINADPRAGCIELRVGHSFREARSILFERTLAACEGNVSAASKILQISSNTLKSWIARRKA